MKILKADSGITVLFSHVPGRLVSVRYTVKCGSVDEKKRKEFGLCHALEHMFFAGTQTRNWEQLLSGFRNCGAYSNAFTSDTHTQYEVLVPKEFLEGAFELMADMMYNAQFPAERWETVEKSAVINEILGYHSEPEWLLDEHTMSHALGGSRKYHSVVGSIDSIKKAKVSDLIPFKERFYTGGNVFLCISGDMTEDEVLRLVSRYDRWDPRPPEARVLKPVGFNYEEATWLKDGVGQPALCFSKPLPKANSLRSTSISEMVLEMFSDHLMLELREKQGLCYGISAEVDEQLPWADYLSIKCVASGPGAKPEMIEQVHRAVDSFVDGYMDSDKIYEARMNTYRNVLMIENSAASHTALTSNAWLAGHSENVVEAIQQHIREVSDAEIREAAAEIVLGTYKITSMEDTEDFQKCNED